MLCWFGCATAILLILFWIVIHSVEGILEDKQFSCIKMPKALESGARDVILKVLSFMREEKRFRAPIIPFEKLYERVAYATGVGERFVRKLAKEKEKADETGTKMPTPSKKRNRTKGKIEVNESDLSVIRKKIHEFHSERKEVPTIPKLLNELKTDINFKASRETLRKILLKNGLRHKKTKPNKEAPVEQNDTSACPNSSRKKADMQKWLSDNNVEFGEHYTKPQLYELIKRHKPALEYEIDNLMKNDGHTVLRFPPYHCDLNPIWHPRTDLEVNEAKSSKPEYWMNKC